MSKTIHIAILDLYEGTENQGMRCLHQIIKEFSSEYQINIQTDVFEVRVQNHLPGMDYDIYISSGGPGSPMQDEDNKWELNYFNWIKSLLDYNNKIENKIKKQVFFICHSFQLACRYFEIATVKKRKSTSFGIFPVHVVSEGRNELIFENLPDPFYAVDNRNYQAVEPNHQNISRIGGKILAIEKERPHVDLERALMAVRFNKYMIGTQFHPEADVIGMNNYFQKESTKQMIIDNHGIEKWESMIAQLHDTDKIQLTYKTILPSFLKNAITMIQP